MAVPEAEFVRPKGAPMWIVTFTDMISLLLTFFIMILTFSSMEEEKMQQATGSLSGAFGVMSDAGRPTRRETAASLDYKFRDRDNNGVINPSLRNDQVKEMLKKVQDRNKYNVKMELEDIEGGTLVKVKTRGDEELFRIGSSTLNTRTTMLLKEIARLFRDLPVRMAIEAHIDDLTPEIIDEDPRTLTLAMALSAAAVMVKEGVTPERVAAAPMGNFFPIAGNTTPLDRFKNRRLNIRILPKTWQEEIQKEKGDE